MVDVKFFSSKIAMFRALQNFLVQASFFFLFSFLFFFSPFFNCDLILSFFFFSFYFLFSHCYSSAWQAIPKCKPTTRRPKEGGTNVKMIYGMNKWVCLEIIKKSIIFHFLLHISLFSFSSFYFYPKSKGQFGGWPQLAARGTPRSRGKRDEEISKRYKNDRESERFDDNNNDDDDNNDDNNMLIIIW